MCEENLQRQNELAAELLEKLEAIKEACGEIPRLDVMGNEAHDLECYLKSIRKECDKLPDFKKMDDDIQQLDIQSFREECDKLPDFKKMADDIEALPDFDNAE